MAIIFQENLEGGSLPGGFTSQVGSGLATGVIDGTSKVTGTYSMKSGATGSGDKYLLKTLATDYSELFINFNIFIPSSYAIGLSSIIYIFQASDSADTYSWVISLENFGEHQLTVYNSETAAYEDTGIKISPDVVHKIQVCIKKSATVGRVRIWVDNDIVDGFPDYDTGVINTGGSTLRNIKFGIVYAPDAQTGFFYTDEYVIADAFITPITGSIENLLPSANNANTGWNAEGGPDYTSIDDPVATPDDGTTKIYSPTANDFFNVALTDTALTTETIVSVTAVLRLLPLSPTDSTFQTYLKIGGTDYFSPTIGVSKTTQYQDRVYRWLLNPATSSAWSVSDLNALILGIKKIDGDGIRLTQMYLMVEYTSGGGSGLSFSIFDAISATESITSFYPYLNISPSENIKLTEDFFKSSVNATYGIVSTNGIVSITF